MSDGSDLPELTKFNLECRVDVGFDANDITAALTRLQVVELMEELDEDLGSWEATILMYRYFKEQYEIALKEVPELTSKTDMDLEVILSKADADLEKTEAA